MSLIEKKKGGWSGKKEKQVGRQSGYRSSSTAWHVILRISVPTEFSNTSAEAESCGPEQVPQGGTALLPSKPHTGGWGASHRWVGAFSLALGSVANSSLSSGFLSGVFLS